MTSLPDVAAASPSRRQIAGTLIVAVLSAASWFAWMGWDTRYQIDPVTGVSSGPYEAWQVIGCGLSLLVVFAGAVALRVRHWYVAAALVAAFTAAWIVTAAQQDDTGTYLFGAVLVAAGLAMATAIGSWVARFISYRGEDNSQPSPPAP